MKYISTRGHPKKLSFMEAIQAGIAPDGGLFIPEIFPSLPETWEEDWSDLTFSELATVLLRFFITESEISTPILSELTHQAFSTFRSEQVTPLVTLAPHLHVLELFHGPTFAFKDIALQFLGVLMKKFPPHSSTTTVLGATSGDTGSAAIHAFKDIPHVRVCILYPKNKISEVQEAQMTTVLNETVCNVSADANFDECQRIVKQAFASNTLCVPLIPVNSINVARILVQMTYYFYAYLHLPVSKETKPKGPVLFSVPSGNFGDALAGYFAKKLGLPIHRLIIATNSNNVLEVFLKTGWYRVQTVQPTLSPAMDISVASNFERALALWVHSPHQVQQYMDDLSKHGAFQVATKVWNHACQDLWSVSVTDQEILEAMHSAYSSYQYLLDPHTAVGWVALHQYPDFQKYPCVVLSTAHPGKFPSAVHQATHIPLSAIIPTTLSTLLKADRRRYHLKTVSLDGLINEVLSKNDWPISGIIKVGSTILKKLDSGLEE